MQATPERDVNSAFGCHSCVMHWCRGGCGKAFDIDRKLAYRLQVQPTPVLRTVLGVQVSVGLQETTAKVTTMTISTESKKNQVSQLHIDKLNAVILKVNDATAHAINNLQEGEKISLKSLTERVARFLGLSQALCAPFVTMFVKSYDSCTMQKGRNGGIYKGKMARKEDLEPRCAHCGQKLRAKRETGGAIASKNSQKAA